VINHKYNLFKWITSHTHEEAERELEGVSFEAEYDPHTLVSNAEAMDILHIPKQNYCCRSKFMTYVEIPDMDPTLYESCNRVEIILKPIEETGEPRKFIAR
jgi:DNA-directed RNA polymerase subunit N (RpoN/RPB10)